MAHPEQKARKKVAVVQSNYIPWKGYFDLINQVDEFILFDDMQYTRRDWRNRNRIKTANGLMWLTIPVVVKGRYLQKIKDTVISDLNWQEEHWKTILHSYSKAQYFKEYRDFFEELYLNCAQQYLSEVNFRFLVGICGLLGVTTKLSWSMDYTLAHDRTERLVDLCKQVGADEYVSGPTAKGYIQEDLFASEKIVLSYADYVGYPVYRQLHEPFEHFVSVVDLVLNEGPHATKFMKSFRLGAEASTGAKLAGY
jgi:WbqC-like protein family